MNSQECNLPIEEINALKELINMQRERIIVIKSCDKGAGILVLDIKCLLQTRDIRSFSWQTLLQPSECVEY